MSHLRAVLIDCRDIQREITVCITVYDPLDGYNSEPGDNKSNLTIDEGRGLWALTKSGAVDFREIGHIGYRKGMSNEVIAVYDPRNDKHVQLLTEEVTMHLKDIFSTLAVPTSSQTATRQEP